MFSILKKKIHKHFLRIWAINQNQLKKKEFLEQKLNYMHQNPVKDKVVLKAEDYLFSSARNYLNMEAMLQVEVSSLFER